MDNVCPVCERGRLIARLGREEFTHGGVRLSISHFAFSVCDACGEEIVLPDQAKQNEIKIADAKRERDGLWGSARLVEFRLRHQLTQSDAAKLLGGGVNAFSKYERGEVIQSQAMDLLIRVSDAIPEARQFLSKRAGIAFGKVNWEVGSRQIVERYGCLRVAGKETISYGGVSWTDLSESSDAEKRRA